MKIYFYPCTLDYFLSDNSEKKSKKIEFFLDSIENCCTFAVVYLTNTL